MSIISGLLARYERLYHSESEYNYIVYTVIVKTRDRKSNPIRYTYKQDIEDYYNGGSYRDSQVSVYYGDSEIVLGIKDYNEETIVWDLDALAEMPPEKIAWQQVPASAHRRSKSKNVTNNVTTNAATGVTTDVNESYIIPKDIDVIIYQKNHVDIAKEIARRYLSLGYKVWLLRNLGPSHPYSDILVVGRNLNNEQDVERNLLFYIRAAKIYGGWSPVQTKRIRNLIDW